MVDTPLSVAQLLQGAPLPTETFTTFLHELTHWSCMSSPVGCAINLLLMRAATMRAGFRHLPEKWSEAVSRLISNQLLAHHNLTDLIAARTAIEFLHPVHEGLALFAEHDLRPSTLSDILSPTNMAAFWLYERPNPGMPPDTIGFLQRRAKLARLSETHTRQKAELLSRSILSSRSPYLCGYLWVKSILYSVLVRLQGRLADPDLGLAFLRRHIFEDWGLVGALLRPTLPEDIGSVGPTLWSVFNNRIAELGTPKFAGNLARNTREFEEFLLRQRQGTHLTYAKAGFHLDFTLYVSEDEVAQAQAAFRRMCTYVDDIVAADPAVDSAAEVEVSRTMRRTLASAPLIVVAEREGWARARADREALLVWDDEGSAQRGEPAAAVVPVNSAQIPPGPVQISSQMALSPLTFRVAVFREERLVWEGQPLSWRGQLPRPDPKLLLTRRQRMECGNLIDELLLEISQEHAELTEQFRDLSRTIESVLVPQALSWVPDEHLQECIEKMSEAGFLSLLAGDRVAVDALAAWSIAVSTGGVDDAPDAAPTLERLDRWVAKYTRLLGVVMSPRGTTTWSQI